MVGPWREQRESAQKDGRSELLISFNSLPAAPTPSPLISRCHHDPRSNLELVRQCDELTFVFPVSYQQCVESLPTLPSSANESVPHSVSEYTADVPT